jgi:asparagine synthase (glutamine-hydrolysing)
MCGIAGIAARTPFNDRDLLVTMRDAMTHRGPDDAGVWWSEDGRVGLSQRRLAIIDLSPGGHQPMSDASGEFWITFNGEIYNYLELRETLVRRGHRFRTASDTEVILEAYRAWGTDCLDHLDGMFAFALYDAKKARLFIARDRAGEKPLYYRHTGRALAFASELKGLMADPTLHREMDVAAFDHYLAYGYVPGELCILRGLKKLPAAHGLLYRLDTGEAEVWRYWRLPEPANDTMRDDEELVEELETLLRQSVRRRLISDVPIGILLSGGIDSSLVTALAAQVSSTPVRTFTIAFPGQGRFNEAEYARIVAERFGTQHTELPAESDTMSLLPALARQYDEPIADSSMIPTYLVSKLIRRHATVAIGGDGGDELFGGYWHYSWLQRTARWRARAPHWLRGLTGRAAAKLTPVGTRGRTYAMGAAGGEANAIAHVDMYFDATARHRLLNPELREAANGRGAPETTKIALCSGGQSLVQQATRVDFSTYMVDDILAKVDRASMLTSLEVRAPWLDHKIIELAFGRVPDRLRATTTQGKILPKRLARKLLPSSLNLDRKQGFSIPIDNWLRGDMGHFVDSVLADADTRLFSRPQIARLQASQRRGLANGKRLFALAMFELWRREYRVAVPA